MPEYSTQLEVAFNYTDPANWCEMFNNWESMELREGLVLGSDYHMLNLSNWAKLKAAFGGGPEIPFFSYQEEVEVESPGGVIEIRKESKHDFQPIRVCVHVMKRTKEVGPSLTLLVSKHLTHNQFKNYLTQVKTDMSSRVEMFVVRATDMPVIHEVSKEKRTLSELGIKDLTDVVIFDVDVSISTINKAELFHIIASQFNIEKHEYENLLPKFEESRDNMNMDFFDSAPIAKQSSFSPPQQPTFEQQPAIPPEYQSDPDLWYAIQASLGNSVPEKNNQGLDEMMEIDEEAVQQDYFGSPP